MKTGFFLLLNVIGLLAQENCKGKCSTVDGKKSCIFTAELDYYASETGYFKFQECGDVHQPTLEMEQGVTYKFVQNDDTNWMHPLGFAYYPDGAHSEVDELEPGISQSTGSSCASDNTCQAPRYFINGQFSGTTYDNTANPAVGGEDFGLDVFEPTFLKGRDEWKEIRDAGTGYEVQLTITDMAFNADVFYFCHVHTKMSGRIVIVNAEGQPVNPNPNTPSLGYDYHVPSEFDKQCGTYDTGEYTKESGKCPGGNFMFCDDMETKDTTFSKCMYALDCHMQHGMRTKLSPDPVAAFMHQMIPHHQNAVNMAKLLLKTGLDASKDPEGDVELMLHEIINGQNKQITMMRGWLEGYEHKNSEDVQCGSYRDNMYSPLCCPPRRGRRLLFGGAGGDTGCRCKN